MRRCLSSVVAWIRPDWVMAPRAGGQGARWLRSVSRRSAPARGRRATASGCASGLASFHHPLWSWAPHSHPSRPRAAARPSDARAAPGPSTACQPARELWRSGAVSPPVASFLPRLHPLSATMVGRGRAAPEPRGWGAQPTGGAPVAAAPWGCEAMRLFRPGTAPRSPPPRKFRPEAADHRARKQQRWRRRGHSSLLPIQSRPTPSVARLDSKGVRRTHSTLTNGASRASPRGRRRSRARARRGATPIH